MACRTAAAVGADAVLALSFPLHPPGRPERSRAAELAQPAATASRCTSSRAAPTRSGRRPRCGPDLPAGATLTEVVGTHSLERAAAEVAADVVAALARTTS